MSSPYFYRDSWVEVDLQSIKRNIEQLKRILPNGKKIFAVVKANAYGHGDIQVAEAALSSGVYGLAVAILDEAIKLRDAGIKAPILVMGWVRPEDVSVAIEKNIILTTFQKEWVKTAKQYVNGTLSLHVKVDTGMGRLGVRSKNELEELLMELNDKKFHIDGIFTHFATADEDNMTYYDKQKEKFNEFLNVLEQYVAHPLIVHSSNSAASIRFPNQMQDAVRFGISMYGLYPSPYVKEEKPIPLSPAFSLHSKLIHVKKLSKGESVSYGCTYTASEDEWVGTVPLGYADGWVRKFQGSTVLIHGKRMAIIGRICMDQFMVKLDNAYDIGTKVTLIGRQEEEEISVDEVADRLETINYEIPCQISYRVPRVYKENDQVVSRHNYLLC
ncbi:alanine racemase [Salirhabdus euzebyi]|uniref:Alanine racemase n=1 Tax=Salirhabdus euzebyi TaxID=394506 RepID=A0A841Q704_9BACI|nr:alanine racemase [Salirhabdus euzebyi]MBB6454186.1 alanine racemase [Salirhabdus euzebyi]